MATRRPTNILTDCMSLQVKHRLLTGLSVIGIVGIFFVPRIPQDPAYHMFADMRTILGIPNALDVLSNFFFAWAGIEGLYRLLRQNSLQVMEELRLPYTVFFAGVALVSLGSAYYHWSPNNETLVWDRLPMTIAFMSFFSILCAERISLKLGLRLFPILLLAGLVSIIYWHFSEQAGKGDLRPYALVQFLPILLTPLILLMLPARYDRTSGIWWFMFWYLMAKLLEWLDAEVFDVLTLVSGHSLKHVAAAIGCLVFLRYLRLRQPINP